MKGMFGLTSSFLMKLSFSQNRIFTRKRNSHASFFLELYLASFVDDITFITLVLP